MIFGFVTACLNVGDTPKWLFSEGNDDFFIGIGVCTIFRMTPYSAIFMWKLMMQLAYFQITPSDSEVFQGPFRAKEGGTDSANDDFR